MKISQLDPYVRFAAGLRYEIPYNKKPVRVTDCRLFYVVAGNARIAIDNCTYHVEPESLFYCCAGSQYTVETQEGFSLISLNFDLSQRYCAAQLPISPIRDPKQWPLMPIYAEAMDDSAFLNSHLFLPKAAVFHEPLEKIIADFAVADPLSRQLCCQRLKLLLLELHRANKKDRPEKVRLVQEYIQEHYAEKITNKALADLVGYHEFHLNRIFLTSTGTNLHEYLLHIRLERAKELILNSDTSLQEIAQLVGFGSYAHFSSYFKQTYNYSPTQYRKQLRGNI